MSLSRALLVAERLFVKLGAGVGPVNNASYGFVQPPSGLYALPLASSGAGVRHTAQFRWAQNIIFDPVHQLLVVISPDGAAGGAIYDTSAWSDATLGDALSAAMRAAPKWVIDEAAATNILNAGAIEFATRDDGTPIFIHSLNLGGSDRGLAFSTLTPTGALSLSLLLGEAGANEYFYYARSKSVGSGQLAVFAAVDPAANNNELRTYLVPTNFGNATNRDRLVMSLNDVTLGSYATLLEFDATQKLLLVGYGSDGLVLVNVTNATNTRQLSTLRTSDVFGDYLVGAKEACPRVNAPLSDIAYINYESAQAYADFNATLNVARWTAAGVLSQDVIRPPNGAQFLQCGAYATSATTRGAVLVTPRNISLYDTAASPPTLRNTRDAPCYEMKYVGQLGSYGLFHHGYNATCNCNATAGPCALGLEVVGNTAANFTSKFGSHLVEGVHLIQAKYAYPMSMFTTGTLEVQLAQDGTSGLTAEQRREGCAALSNSNLNGSVCLVYRGTCSFNAKIDNCLALGAAAVLIVQRANQSLFNIDTEIYDIPIALVSFEVGEAMRLALAAPNGSPAAVTVTQPTLVIPPLPAVASTGTPPAASPSVPSSSSSTTSTAAPSPAATTTSTTNPPPSTATGSAALATLSALAAIACALATIA